MNHTESFSRSETILSSSLPVSTLVNHPAGDSDRPLTSEGRLPMTADDATQQAPDCDPSTPQRTIRPPHYRTLTGPPSSSSPYRTPLFAPGSDRISTPPSAFRQPVPTSAPDDGRLPTVPSSTFPFSSTARDCRDSRGDDLPLPVFRPHHHPNHYQYSPHRHGEFPPPPFSTSVLVTPSKTAPAPPLAVQTGAVGRTVHSVQSPSGQGSQMVACEFASNVFQLQLILL